MRMLRKAKKQGYNYMDDILKNKNIKKEKASVSQSKFLERVKVDGQWLELWHSQEPEHLKEASLATEKIDA